MPPGTPTSRFGHPAPPSLATRAESLVPQSRLFQDLTGQDWVQRYANGQPVLLKSNGYQPIKTGSDLAETAAGMAGLTLTNKAVAEEAAAQSAKSAGKTAKTNLKTAIKFDGRVLKLKG